MKYDIFISYRRIGGAYLASFLKIALKDKGINEDRIFLDTHSMHNTKDYEDYLGRAIEDSANFIVIVTPNSFLDEQKEKDIYLDEIAKALECGTNIVPIFIDGVNSFDDFTIPERISAIKKVNGITYNNEYSDGFIEKLLSFLILNPQDTTSKTPHSRFNFNIRSKGCTMSVVLMSFFCVVVFASVWSFTTDSPIRKFYEKYTRTQDTTTNSTLQDSLVCLDRINNSIGCCDSISNDSIDRCDSLIHEEPSDYHDKKVYNKSKEVLNKKDEPIKVDTSTIIPEKKDSSQTMCADSEVVLEYSEIMPEFPGGMEALIAFLSKNVQYPDSAEDNGIQGRVVCRFTVGREGQIRNVHVVKSSGNNLLDIEAVRVISVMPRWIPGRQNGQAVNVSYTVPITFRL